MLLHGPNLWPARPVELRVAVQRWMEVMSGLAEALLRGMAVGLGLEAEYFERRLTADPTVLFRAFHYPRVTVGSSAWGVGEHTDYGLLTILAQDRSGGLQVRTVDGWVDVPPDPDAFVCNIGDMLDRMTGGRYRSTPHRVVASSTRDRVSFPYFFDPGWDVSVEPIPVPGDAPPDDGLDRWDGTSLRHLSGTYGEYLSEKPSPRSSRRSRTRSPGVPAGITGVTDRRVSRSVSLISMADDTVLQDDVATTDPVLQTVPPGCPMADGGSVPVLCTSQG